MNARTVGPLMGILFVVLAAAAFIVGGETPGTDDAKQEIIDFYVDNDDAQAIAGFLMSLGIVAFLFFLAALRRRLRAGTGDEGGLSTAAMLGGLMFAVGWALLAGISFTLGDAADELPPDAILALNALNSDLFFPIAIGTAVFNLGLGLSVLRHGAFPRWLGWVTIVVGVVGMTPAGFFSVLATAIVIVIVSVLLLQGEDEPATPAHPVG